MRSQTATVTGCGIASCECAGEQTVRGAAHISDDDCLRHYEANRHRYVKGQALHVRHILFAVHPGDNVHALTVRAEGVLLALSRPDVPAQRFAQLAAELSDCPTGAQGGDLGWIGVADCAPELANELFEQKHSRWGMGVHPRLIHTGQGFHIIEVMGRRKGRALPYAEVRARIADELARQAGLDLEGAGLPAAP